jgi:hypothetical protein
MYFFKRGRLAGSIHRSRPQDLKTALPRKLTFTDPEKIRELARRRRGLARLGEPADA